MKSRFKVLSLMAVVLLLFGVTGMASAQNAAQVDIQIGYPCNGLTGQDPCDTDEAVSDFTNGDDINLYITLLDANGGPALFGPEGQPLATVTATVLSTLTISGSMTGGVFSDDDIAVSLTEGSARVTVSCTKSLTGTNTFTVLVPTSGDPLFDTATANIVAPDATDLVVRLNRGTASPVLLYTDMFQPPYDQSGNFGADEIEGTPVQFEVVAVEGNGLYTDAPNLEGVEIMVNAYANYDSSVVIGDIPEELVPVNAEPVTVIMSGGKAAGTITINTASPDGLLHAVTAMAVLPPALPLVQTTQLPVDDGPLNNVGSAPDDDVDYVTILSPTLPVGIIIGVDTFLNGSHVAAVDCIQVFDNPALETDVTAILVSPLGNAVRNGGTVRTVTATIASNLETLIVDGVGGGAVDSSTAWDIPANDYKADGALADAAVVNDDGVELGFLELTSTPFSDTADVALLPEAGGGLDFDLDVTTPTPPTTINPGDTVTLSLTAVSTLPVAETDTLTIDGSTADGALWLSTGDQEFADRTESLVVTADDVDDDPANGIQVEIRIWGFVNETPKPVTINVTDNSKCNIMASSVGQITGIDPGTATFLAILAVDGDPNNIEDPNADPIIVTKTYFANGVDQNLINTGDAQTLDQYGNIVDPTPGLMGDSFRGTATEDAEIDISYPPAAAGETDDIVVTTTTGVELQSNLRVVTITPVPAAIEPSAIEVRQAGPQAVDGLLIPPDAGGEAEIRIRGDAGSTTIQAQINLSAAEGTPELRTLTSQQPITLPRTFTLTLNEDTRFVVSGVGAVTVTVTDLAATDPLTPGTLTLDFGAVADCEVAISPSATVILPGGELTFTAETTCEGVVQALAATPNYAWEISVAECTGSSIDAATGTYTAGAEDNGCQDTIMVTDAANGGAEATATVAVTDILPSVSISGPATVGPPCPDSATYTAETTLGDTTIEGTYTWELDGVSSGTGNTGNTFEVDCTVDGPRTLMVTDTANGNITSSITITCECIVVPTESIEAEFTGCGSPLLLWFGLTRIQATGTEFGLTSIVSYDSPLVLKTPRVIGLDRTTITQFVFLLPSFGPNFLPLLDYPATVTVTVDGLSDTFEIPACGG